jgi:hypothetical protein
VERQLSLDAFYKLYAFLHRIVSSRQLQNCLIKLDPEDHLAYDSAVGAMLTISKKSLD